MAYEKQIKNKVSAEDKILIKQMLLGPFRAEWRDSKGKVDNTDPTIARRTGYSISKIKYVTDEILEDHINSKK